MVAGQFKLLTLYCKEVIHRKKVPESQVHELKTHMTANKNAAVILQL